MFTTSYLLLLFFGDREGEKHQGETETSIGYLSYAHSLGMHPDPE